MESTSDDSDYLDGVKHKTIRGPPKKKKRKNSGVEYDPAPPFTLQPVLSTLKEEFRYEDDTGFSLFIEPMLDDLRSAEDSDVENRVELDANGNLVRPLTLKEKEALLDELNHRPSLSLGERILRRKLLSSSYRDGKPSPPSTLTPLPPVQSTPPANPEVLDALYAIQKTPYESSFLSRLNGIPDVQPPGLISVDWEVKTSWMCLMEDIREHYALAHPDREQPIESVAPISYANLHASMLPQVHDLLERSFWRGIDVADSLDYWPEKSTVVALYKNVVVGVALLSSPREMYIMYLAVKAGWDKAQIARTMLYHLISLNPGKDITLHVSANNSAMLLYNQFGFKAEEFIADFYGQYLDANSRASKNAFRLRLRHQ